MRASARRFSLAGRIVTRLHRLQLCYTPRCQSERARRLRWKGTLGPVAFQRCLATARNRSRAVQPLLHGPTRQSASVTTVSPGMGSSSDAPLPFDVVIIVSGPAGGAAAALLARAGRRVLL